MYRIEDTESAIKDVQRLLSVNQSGIFDDKTRKKVVEIQEKYEIDKSGVVDYETFKKISLEHRIKQSGMRTNDYLFNPNFPFIESNFSDNVEKINGILSLVLSDYAYEGILPKGKYYGKSTVDGVGYMRKIFGMEDSEEVDAVFFNRITSEKRAIELKRIFGI